MAWRGEVEDGLGWGGLVASKSEQREEARLAALERDAARYRWLREQSNLVAGMMGDGIGMACGNWSKDDQDKRTLDTAIDAAMNGAN